MPSSSNCHAILPDKGKERTSLWWKERERQGEGNEGRGGEWEGGKNRGRERER